MYRGGFHESVHPVITFKSYECSELRANDNILERSSSVNIRRVRAVCSRDAAVNISLRFAILLSRTYMYIFRSRSHCTGYALTPRLAYWHKFSKNVDTGEDGGQKVTK